MGSEYDEHAGECEDCTAAGQTCPACVRTMIYFVVTVRPNGESRTVGYFLEYKDAEEVILGNVRNIYEEGWYPHALIESLEPGLYPIPPGMGSKWFEWRRAMPCTDIYKKEMEMDGYKPCPTPDKFKRIIGWAVG